MHTEKRIQFPEKVESGFVWGFEFGPCLDGNRKRKEALFGDGAGRSNSNGNDVLEEMVHESPHSVCCSCKRWMEGILLFWCCLCFGMQILLDKKEVGPTSNSLVFEEDLFYEKGLTVPTTAWTKCSTLDGAD